MEITIRNTNYAFTDIIIKSGGTTIEETVYEPESIHDLFYEALGDTFTNQNDLTEYINKKLTE